MPLRLELCRQLLHSPVGCRHTTWPACKVLSVAVACACLSVLLQGVSSLMYSPFELHCQTRKAGQIHLLKQQVMGGWGTRDCCEQQTREQPSAGSPSRRWQGWSRWRWLPCIAQHWLVSKVANH
jgi:hypothetical protein